MDQKPPERTDEAPPQSRTEWTRPQVERLVAGGAEAGGDTSTDGIDILS